MYVCGCIFLLKTELCYNLIGLCVKTEVLIVSCFTSHILISHLVHLSTKRLIQVCTSQPKDLPPNRGM